jgi:hypothetical protein
MGCLLSILSSPSSRKIYIPKGKLYTWVPTEDVVNENLKDATKVQSSSARVTLDQAAANFR